MKMRESAGTFLYVLKEVLVIYRFLRSTEEFPNSAEYRKIKGYSTPLGARNDHFHSPEIRSSTSCRQSCPSLLEASGKTERRLTKACEYYHGINDLIRYAKRHFPDGKESGANARERLPGVGKRWSDNRSLKTRVHPEICILLHLSISFDSSDILYRQAIEQEVEYTP
ncbi:hypothetical protein BKA82DRAFT_20132 [Pisolithus tinctorius]|uniref:Uncharacterized protein n=1 Tax=Pisolithus tinctorius Marx 270 TaxID=870435 RepID=A0A0C3PCE7_PISTI|nr:hypothetical protein BKA82DRAFT_20132 [Pisolithus tinctorius]KIO11450.1 hypothetical protein M404DRAFT_20132 [Pisolithus tinctorius Marx 270]